ncbi:hypothetical protein FOL46_003763 [Perkinsus olseni]|nr:hypothetical protein FOL46_003763 [Perkinsus olseni]
MSDPEDNASAYSEPRRGRHPSRTRSRSGGQSEARLLPNPQASAGVGPPGRDNTCHLWRDTGKCRYGDMCKFEHVGDNRGTIRSRIDPSEIPTPKHPLIQIMERCNLPPSDEMPLETISSVHTSKPGVVVTPEPTTSTPPLVQDVLDVYPAKLKFGEKSRVVRLEGHTTVGEILVKYGSKSNLNVCKDKDGVELDHDLTLIQVRTLAGCKDAADVVGLDLAAEEEW